MLRRPTTLCLAALLLAPGLAAAPAHADGVRFLGTGVVDGTGTDRSGLPATLLEDGVSPQNGLNGLGSGLAYAGQGNRYVLLPDRGPNKVEYAGGAKLDNTTSYPNRFQTFDITVAEDAAAPSGWRVTLQHVATTLLKNAEGEQYLGISTALATPGHANRRLDSEGIRVAPDGSVWISDEYGPYLLHFDQQGKQIGELAFPAGFTIARPAENLKTEMAENHVGRVTNRGAEGLALSADGRWLVVAMQGALLQDGGAKGLNARLVAYDLHAPAAPPRQFLYPLDSTQLAISEILAVDSSRFLVDERDGTPGAKGRKLLYLVDLAQSPAATDLAGTAYQGNPGTGLPVSEVPAGVTALKKTLLADIGALLNAAEAAGQHAFANKAGLPDKIEGYAWGPDLPNGDHLLLASDDNDFTTLANGFPNYVFAFAVPDAVLHGVQVGKLAAGVHFGP
jgi:hypothetical protein